MKLDDKPATDQQGEFFRCPVGTEHSQAVIRVGRQRVAATLHETSIDGFTVLVEPRNTRKLKVGQTWVLEHDEALIEVHPQWLFNAPDGRAQIGLRRLRDITPPEKHKRRSLLVYYGGRRYEDPSLSAAVFGGFVLFLFSLLALPGLGDHIGTSDRIQNAVRWVLQEINQIL